MAYIGSTPTSQNFISGTDYFNGTGSQTAFTLTRTVNSVNDIEAVVNNVVQRPNDAYTLSGTTITFTSAPSSGTNNIYVRYLSTTLQSITVPANSITRNQLDSNLQSVAIGKNKIINGAMVIDQRNAGASVSINPDAYTLDRWKAFASGTAKFSVQQNAGSVTPPVGFTNYLGMTSLAATTVGSTDYFLIRQNIEGYNVADLGWGTANAKTITLSFWVRSSLTGTFGGSLQNSAGNRSYPFTYTINSANTWEYETITIAGDTSGTWLTTNGLGLQVNFSIGMGSTYSGTAGAWAAAGYNSATGATSVVGTNGATFYITGVQLEVGSSATGYEYRQYGQELALCQRYYEKNFPADVAPTNSYGNGFGGGSNAWVSFSTTNIRGPQFGFRVSKRASPTMVYYNGNSPTSGTLGIYDAVASTWRATTAGTTYVTTEEWRTDSTTSGWTPVTGNAYLFSGWWTASAEL